MGLFSGWRDVTNDSCREVQKRGNEYRYRFCDGNKRGRWLYGKPHCMNA